MIMTDYEKMQKSTHNLVNEFYTITEMLNDISDLDKMDLQLATADKISVILKRLMETGIPIEGVAIETTTQKGKEESE